MKGGNCIVDGEIFSVGFDQSGNPQWIKECKVFPKGHPDKLIYGLPYWSHPQKLDGPQTQIIATTRIITHIPNEETQAAIRESRALAREQKT